MAAAAQPHYASASLYVGDLAPDVNETMLFEVFNAIGPVASIRVCRESGTRKSLGYAYVNYHSIHDAERALDTLNFTAVKGNPCRIMWSHRDPSLRKSGSGNIFVKNLDKSIDNKSLYDTFSLFGNILSCKVATDEFGKSRGYGFVHYETEDSAKRAAEKVNGMLIGARNVFVGPFKKRSERQTTRSKNYTNLYVKHFPETWTDDTLHKVFIPFGAITSSAISTDAKGRRFGFVNYEECDSARAAVEELHGKRVSEEGISEDQSEDKPEEKKEEEKKEVQPQENGKTDTNGTTSSQASGIEDSGRLYVQRAMTKGERIAMLKEQFNNNNVEKQKQAQQQGVNLYVKNLDDQVTDEGLSEAFSKYGTVTSAKIMRDESGASKGFGFVCFAFPDDATKAVTAMHLKLFMGKPLYVGLAEKRDHRTARLQQRFRMSARPNTAGQPMVVGAGGAGAGHNAPQQPQIVQPFGGHMYYGAGGAQQQGGGGPLQQQRAIPGPGFAPPGGAWRQQAAPRGYGGPGGFQMNPPPMGAGTPMYPYQQQMGGGPDMNSAMSGSNPPNNSNNALLMRGMGGGPRGPRYSGVGMQQGGHMGGGGGQGVPNFKFTPQARNRDYPQSHHPHGQMQQQQQRPMMNDPTMLTSSGDLLSAQSLAAAHPQMQKQMLGEKLFPLVAKHQPELAGKITGMMLEMDNGELLSLLESEVQLQAKVDEALGVLHRHQAIPGGPQPGQPQQSGVGVGGGSAVAAAAAAAHSSPINPAA